LDSDMSDRPHVGVGVLILKDGKVLLGKRQASHGAGTWSTPGGHLEFNETFEACALREAYEETGLTDLSIERIIYVGNERVYDKHFVNIGLLAHWKSGEPFAAEPEKSRDWSWFAPDELPENIFLPSKWVIESWISGVLYKAS